MPERKQFENVTAPDPELMRLLEESQGRILSDEELREQRVSFAFGNALDSETIRDKESIRAASARVKPLG